MIKKILLLAAVLFLTGPLAAHADVEWYSCTNDSECVVVGSGCWLTAVNKDSERVADRYFNSQKPKACAPIAKKHARCFSVKRACQNADGGYDVTHTCSVKVCQLAED